MILCLSHPLQIFRHGFAMLGDSSAPWITERPEVGVQRSDVGPDYCIYHRQCASKLEGRFTVLQLELSRL